MPDGPKLRAKPLMPPFRVVLVEPEIPPNTGAVARTCAATQSPLHLVGPLGFRIDAHAVRRAGLDYWPLVDLHRHDDLVDFEVAHPQARLHLFTGRAERSFYEADLRPGDALVFGKESVGLGDALLEAHAERTWAIPTSGAFEASTSPTPWPWSCTRHFGETAPGTTPSWAESLAISRRVTGVGWTHAERRHTVDFSPMLRPALLLSLSALGVAACGDDGGMDATPPDAAMDTAVMDAAMDTAMEADAGPPDICDELSLPRRPFADRASGSDYGTVAGDFSVETRAGTWRLSEAWSGCESYVFLNYFASDPGDQMWASYPDPLFENSKRNVQYFFTTYESAAADVAARMDAMEANVEDALTRLSAEDADFWRARVHYVTTPINEIDGSLGALVRGKTSVEFAIGIDRAQRFDPVGSLAQVSGGAFYWRLGMAAWASHFYDYRFELDERLSGESDATVVALVSETDLSERVLVRTVTLPDAAAMAAFDHFEIDVQIECHQGPADCSEWDRIAAIFLCSDDTCTEDQELVRWITPYARPGRRRWVIDATPMLGLLGDAGERTFRIVMGPEWEDATLRDADMNLRFSSRGETDRAFAAELAYVGGAFDDTYDAAHPPFLFTPPAGTTRVELVTLISGHGQTDGDNCAEWCNHEHVFTIGGGTPRRIDFPGMAGTPQGCAELSGSGVVPGQYGNWAPRRAGWCPGLPVDAVRMDVTDDVTLGAENELTYEASFAGGAPRGGNIDLSTYVVYYR